MSRQVVKQLTMSRTHGATLIEVLVALFVTSIGLLALLALFPLGALDMYQAIKDSRCTLAAANASAILNAQHLRNDPNVTSKLTAPGGNTVYVDPVGKLALGSDSIANLVATDPNMIPRVPPSFIGTFSQANRWFSLWDDMTFIDAGIPGSGSGTIQRDIRYTWAYLMRNSIVSKQIDCTIVVYANRSTTTLLETPYTVINLNPPNALTLDYTGSDRPAIRAGGWILDTTGGKGKFYRVVSVADGSAAFTLDIEVQQNYTQAPPAQLVVLENVAEVFERGPR